MNIIDIITKKKNKEELTEEEIKYVVNGFVSGDIKDYQMSALLMAIVINDMTDNEVIYLTKYILYIYKTYSLCIKIHIVYIWNMYEIHISISSIREMI